jgi:hypothetical protein
MEISKLKNSNIYLSVVVAFIIGIVQLFVLDYCWRFISMYSQLPTWAIESGIRGASFSIFFFITDLLLNIIICLPAAYALCKLRPQKLLVYLPLAVIPGFLWQYRLVFTDPSAFYNWTVFAPGAFSAIFMLPIAVLIIYVAVFKKRLTTQSSGTSV